MSPQTIEMEGTLQPDGKLILDTRPALPPGRVRVALQAIGGEAKDDVLTILDRIRVAQKARGLSARSRAEIDAAIANMRNEDEERMTGLQRLHEECKRHRQAESAAD